MPTDAKHILLNNNNPPQPGVLELVVKPHRERGGYHLDRFDAYLDDTFLLTSRQPLLDGARHLFTSGHSPETLLTMRHAGKATSFIPRSIGDLMGWAVYECDRTGLRRARWRPYAERGPHALEMQHAD